MNKSKPADQAYLYIGLYLLCGMSIIYYKSGEMSRGFGVISKKFLQNRRGDHSSPAKKASQSSPPAGGENSKIVFSGDMCLGKNSSHVARVAAAKGRKARSGVQLKKVPALF